MEARSARAAWDRLHNERMSLLTRWEKMAGWTIPRVCRREHYKETTEVSQYDWQSVGAQAVNHVVNKLMLTLFAPSRPFMRLTASADAVAELAAAGLPQSAIEEAMTTAEKEAIRELDRVGDIRPRLHQAILNMVTIGNACVFFPDKADETFKVFYARNWAVSRDSQGHVRELVLKETYQYADLEPAVREALGAGHKRLDEKAELLTWIVRNENHGYNVTQWVDNKQLPDKFSGSYSSYERLPYKVFTWALQDGADYGTGLVEDYYGDFAALSALSESLVNGAILASEHRWLVNPTGMTKPEDLENSENGAALAGSPDDISLLETGKSGDLAVVQAVVQDYVQRIGRGFLLGSAMTRDAERVTAEEIRMQATELETSLGGAYSRAAVEVQLPIAIWLLKRVKITLNDRDIKVSIITGLDALSRSGDLDALRAALQDVTLVKSIEQIADELNVNEIMGAIFNGHGLSSTKYVKPPEQVQAERQQRQQEALNAAASEVGMEAGAQAAVNQTQ